MKLLISLLLIIYYFQDNPDPHRFDSEIKKYKEMDQQNPVKPGGILFLGSSSIRMWKSLEDDFKEFPVMNRGFGGSHTSDVLYYFNELVLPYKPSLIIFYEGDNDLASGKSPEQVFSDFLQLETMVEKFLPETKIGFIAVKPSPSRWHLKDKYQTFNQKIKLYSLENENISYIDIYTPMINRDGRPDPELFIEDSLHMSHKGYDIWRKRVKTLLEMEFNK